MQRIVLLWQPLADSGVLINSKPVAIVDHSHVVINDRIHKLGIAFGCSDSGFAVLGLRQVRILPPSNC